MFPFRITLIYFESCEEGDVALIMDVIPLWSMSTGPIDTDKAQQKADPYQW